MVPMLYRKELVCFRCHRRRSERRVTRGTKYKREKIPCNTCGNDFMSENRKWNKHCKLCKAKWGIYDIRETAIARWGPR